MLLFRYVKLYILPDKNGKLKTTVKKNTTDPVYNEVLKVRMTPFRLQASVWHSRTLKRKTFLGEVLIPLDGWRFEDDHENVYLFGVIKSVTYLLIKYLFVN
uniref:C2 domain-containing protein n=1 Tax=Mola mola TaxID=94237 RepID=A0A3Q3VPV8_MOLML